jgi:myo-inositol-1(or 4)-monophosphatase
MTTTNASGHHDASLAQIPAELAEIVTLARRAGDLAMGGFGRSERLLKTSAGAAIAGIEQVEAVTAYDRAVQKLIVEHLRARHPGDGIIGEENEAGGITAMNATAGETAWVIDPIDGTNNYVAGFAAFAVCIARMDAGMPVLGVVHDPVRGVTYAGIQLGVNKVGAWVISAGGARPVTVQPGSADGRALVMMTCNLMDRHGRLPGFITHWLLRAPWRMRMLGSAAMECAEVGAGTAHAALTINGKLWDVAAAAAVVLAAGGVVTDLTGKPRFPYATANYDGAKVPFLAGGPKAHAELLADIRNFGWPT